MPKTPGKMHMYDMVKIDTIVFDIVVGAFNPPPLIVSCLKYPGSDRVNTQVIFYNNDIITTFIIIYLFIFSCNLSI